MGGLFYRDYRADPERQGSEGPPAPALDVFDAVTETYQDRSGWNRNQAREAAYRGLLDGLNGVLPARDMFVLRGRLTNGSPAAVDQSYAQWWDAADRARKTNPRLFKTLPKTRDEFEAQIQARLTRARQANKSIASRAEGVSGALAGLAGGMVGSLSDPFNVATMPLGGGPGVSLARRVLIDGLVNAGVEAAQLPAAQKELARYGDAETPMEMATSVLMAGAAGAALPALAHGAGKAAKPLASGAKTMQEAAWARIVPYLPQKYRPAMTMDAVPDGVLAEAVDKALATQDVLPELRGAINQLRAKAALDAANPFVADPAGIAAHDRAMQDALTAVLADPGARAQPAPRGRTAPAPSTALGSGTVPQSMGRAQLKAVIGRAENASGSNTARPIDPQTGRLLSSALGRYQFTQGTWTRLYKARFGAQGMSDGQIAALRTDPALQETLMDDLISLNARMLRRIGAPETAGNLYLAHFAGEGAAARVLTADPAMPISRIMSAEAIAANRHIRGIENFTAQDLINWAHRRMGESGGAGLGGTGGDDAALLAMRRMEADRAMNDAQAALDQRPAPLVETPEPLATPTHDGEDIAIPLRPAEVPQARPEVDALVPRIQSLVQDAGRPSLHPAKLAERLGAAEADVQMALARVKGLSPFTGKDGRLTYRRTPQSSGPEDLLTFVARRGGVRDDEGHDLKTVFEQVFDRRFTRTVTVAKGPDGKAIKGKDARKVTIRQTAFVPGAGPLIRKTGLALDRMREAVAEAGYFAGRFGRNEDDIALSTTADLIDLMTEAWAGKRKIYPNGEAPNKVPADLHWMEAAALDHIDTAAGRWGLDLTEEDRALAMTLYDGDGDQALLDMIDRRLSDAVMDAYAESADDAYAFPNWIEDPANGAGRGAESGNGPQPDTGDPGPGSAGRGYGGPDEPPEGWGPIDPEPLASFDAPDGMGMVRQADSLSHDLRAAMDVAPEAHIGNRVEAALLTDGWDAIGPNTFRKRIEGFEDAGTVSDGARVITLEMDDSGRWLSRTSGWGTIENDVDLRRFPNDPKGAIAAVMGARIPDGAQSDAFGGVTAADTKAMMERQAQGRMQAGVAQKPPGSDGGLFDSQAVQEGKDFRMDDEGDVINPADLLAMLDEEETAIRTMKDCMK